MPRKKSVERSVFNFKEQAGEIKIFVQAAKKHFTDKHVSWAYEYAIIRLYREFEAMMLDTLVGAINNDTTTISKRTGVNFPKHLTDEVCRYLIVGSGYFDFKGRDGLIRTLKKYVPNDHYLVEVVTNDRYKDALEKLYILRNLAAHSSAIAKRRAKRVLGLQRMPDAGVWLKRQNRFEGIVGSLTQLADEIEENAPY